MTQEQRVETGKMQFEDDWPGVFIGGMRPSLTRRLFAGSWRPKRFTIYLITRWANVVPTFLSLRRFWSRVALHGRGQAPMTWSNDGTSLRRLGTLRETARRLDGDKKGASPWLYSNAS